MSKGTRHDNFSIHSKSDIQFSILDSNENCILNPFSLSCKPLNRVLCLDTDLIYPSNIAIRERFKEPKFMLLALLPFS